MRPKAADWGLLLLLTAAAFLVHGYHPGAEDAEIYLPQIKKLLHPALYPFGSEFFESHARLTLFPEIVAWPVRLLHAPLAGVLLALHLATIFLLLFACWKLSARLWSGVASRWAGVALVAMLLTMPVAGTELYILDQYLNPRSISVFTILFAIDAAFDRRYGLAALWLFLTALVHPLMAAFGVLFVVVLAFDGEWARSPGMTAAMTWPGFLFAHPSAAWWRCLADHSYYHLLRWEWYEWLGIVAPLAIFWWFARGGTDGAASSGGTDAASAARRRMARVVLVFGAICFATSLAVMIPQKFAALAIYQPARGYQLVYIFLLLIGGGWLGERLLRRSTARWAMLFLPLCFGMFYAQLQLFPADRHIEWPGSAPANPWLRAFAWIRTNTPENAVFALDPNYMALPGEDQQGFRAIAERSSLADANKDWSAAVMFPGLPLADHCLEQIRAASPWNALGVAGLRTLNRAYGVNWVVLDEPRGAPASGDLNCPYRNRAVSVCRLE
ncbi:MAG TPA: DUF6798 domain-containing protein [Candidatus Acidoferrales bacterium]|nr:DUF6798 domain-containing protein [Candidatus Acidoferrales bacterium]